MELRAYRDVKNRLETPGLEEADVPDSPLVDVVFANRERQMAEGG